MTDRACTAPLTRDSVVQNAKESIFPNNLSAIERTNANKHTCPMNRCVVGESKNFHVPCKSRRCHRRFPVPLSNFAFCPLLSSSVSVLRGVRVCVSVCVCISVCVCLYLVTQCVCVCVGAVETARACFSLSKSGVLAGLARPQQPASRRLPAIFFGLRDNDYILAF